MVGVFPMDQMHTTLERELALNHFISFLRGPPGKGTWTSHEVFGLVGMGPLENHGLGGGGWWTSSTLNTKLCLAHESCSWRGQWAHSQWIHKSAQETRRQHATSARSPVQNTILWTCQFKKEIFLSSPLSILWPQSSQYQQLGSQDRMEGVIASPTSMLQAASLQWAQLGPGRRCELNQVWSFRLQFERIILISE